MRAHTALALTLALFSAAWPAWPNDIEAQDGLTPQEVADLMQAAGFDDVVPRSGRNLPACADQPRITPRNGDARLIEIRCDNPVWQRAFERDAQRPMRGRPSTPEVAQMLQVTLRESLPRGAVLAPSHLQLVPVAQSAASMGFAEIAPLVGRRLSVAVGIGRVLQARHLEQDYAIRQGAQVEIRATGALMSVSMAGEALEPGQHGEMIRVRNRRSGREIRAEILDDQTVLVRPNMN